MSGGAGGWRHDPDAPLRRALLPLEGVGRVTIRRAAEAAGCAIDTRVGDLDEGQVREVARILDEARHFLL